MYRNWELSLLKWTLLLRPFGSKYFLIVALYFSISIVPFWLCGSQEYDILYSIVQAVHNHLKSD